MNVTRGNDGKVRAIGHAEPPTPALLRPALALFDSLARRLGRSKPRPVTVAQTTAG